jgi:toxin secretion/phage lysis holin
MTGKGKRALAMINLAQSLRNSLEGHNSESFLALAISVAAYVLGGFSYLLPILVIMMIIDYVTGIIASIVKERRFSRKTAVQGAAKKIAYLFFVIFAQLMDAVVAAVNQTEIINVGNFHYLGFITNVYLIATEGLSIAQNTAECGMPLPKPLLRFFKKIEGIGEEKP